MVPVTIDLIHSPVAVPRSTSPPKPGRPDSPVVHIMYRPPCKCGREPQRPFMPVQGGLFFHCQDQGETYRLIWFSSFALEQVPFSSVHISSRFPCYMFIAIHSARFCVAPSQERYDWSPRGSYFDQAFLSANERCRNPWR